MNNRESKIKLLDSIFNQSNRDSLKSLSRPIYPRVLIFEPQGGGLVFSGRLNPTLPARYRDKVLNDNEVNTLLSKNGSLTVFFLPDNGRD